MTSDWLDELGTAIVRRIRDDAIAELDRSFHADAKDVVSKRWKRMLPTSSAVEFAQHVVPDCVDAAICALLHAIDSGILRINYETSDGRKVDLQRDGKGELVGWYMGTWREELSKERTYDDFSNL